jgi:hypothetical protein
MVIQQKLSETTITVPVPDHSELRVVLYFQSFGSAAFLAANSNHETDSPLRLQNSSSSGGTARPWPGMKGMGATG